jgi:hypothetical protein
VLASRKTGGEKISADLHPILSAEGKFCRPVFIRGKLIPFFRRSDIFAKGVFPEKVCVTNENTLVPV